MTTYSDMSVPERRRPKIVCLVLVLLVAVGGFIAGQDGEEVSERWNLELSMPSEVTRGEAFVGSLSVPDAVVPSDIEEITFVLIDPEGEIRSTTTAFPVGDTHEIPEWRGIVGIPSTATVAEWELRARAQFTDYCVEVSEAIDVRDGEYRTMRIDLDDDLSALMTEPDPRREREREELWELLGSADADAIYDYGPFEKPVEERRRSATFGDRRQYVYSNGEESRSIHRGLDYAAPAGTEVRAAGHGRVRLADERLMSGNTVVIEHLPGLFSLYYHLQSLEVEPGDFVLRGTPVGAVGMTGLATGPHLHWEIRQARVAVSPEWFLESSVFGIRE